MKLRFAQVHFRNTAISCNGHRYVTDSDGCIEVEDIEDIKKFLQNPTCERVVQRTLQMDTAEIKEKPSTGSFLISDEKETKDEIEFPTPSIEGVGFPTPSMSMNKLKNIADELRVDYSDRPKKQELYERLISFIKG